MISIFRLTRFTQQEIMSKRKTRSSTKDNGGGDEEPPLKKSKFTQDSKETKKEGKSIIPVEQQEGLLERVAKFGQPNEEMTRAFRWLIALDVQDHHNRGHACVQLGEFIKDRFAHMASPNEKLRGKVIYNIDEYLRQFLDMKPQVYYHELIQLVQDKVTVEYSFSNGECVDPNNTAVVYPETAWIWTNDSGKIVMYSIEFATLDRLSMRVFEQGKLPILFADEQEARLADKGFKARDNVQY